MVQPQISELNECLSAMRVKRREPGREPAFHTHVSMVAPRGTFQMDIARMEEFWANYCEYATSGATGVGLAEKTQQYMPVVVDLDIKLIDTFESFPVYTRAQIEAVVAVYQSVIREITDTEPEDLLCAVLEKPHAFSTVNDVQYVKNGVHLHFPRIFLDKKEHHVFLMPLVMAKMKSAGMFESLGIEDSSSLVDTQYSTVPWLMYKSHKDGGEPYTLSYVLDHSLREVSLADFVAACPVYDADENIIDTSACPEKFLPRVLSVLPFHRPICTVKPSVVSPIKRSMPTLHTVRQEQCDVDVAENLVKAKKLVQMLSPSRAESRIDWLNVGWALYNVGLGSVDALDLWTEFSRMCPDKFSEAVCIYEWEHMTVKNITMGTLAYFAKNDNPDAYSKMVSQARMNSDIKDTHADIAQKLYELHGHTYVCASIRNNIWFKFENHHWQQVEGPIYLRRKISTDIVSMYERDLKSLEAQSGESDGWKSQMFEAGIKAIKKLIKSLKSHPFKANVIKECADLFFHDNFLERLDANRYLFGFQNGVYDLREHKLRPGIPEDYISTQSPMNYTQFDLSDDKVHQVYDCLRKTFPDRDVFDYFMDTTSEVFIGGNSRKLVLFWSGKGNNGKSVIQTFIESILGPYSIKFPTALITGKRAQSSSCTPELARAGNGVRWAVVQEPDETEYINIGVLKELSGNDTFYARSLYQSGREITPMFKLLIVCNKQPKLPHIDQATINRLCVIPYESVFSDNAPVDPAEQLRLKVFPKSGDYIRDKVPELAEAFLWVLLEHLKHPKTSEVPSKVRVATDAYIQRNDHYRQFIEENIVDDCNGRILSAELYPMFKDWLRANVPNTPTPTSLDVREYFENVWGDCRKGVWSGVRIRSVNDDLAPDNSVSGETLEVDLGSVSGRPQL